MAKAEISPNPESGFPYNGRKEYLIHPFLRGLFLEGLIFEEAYLWWEICVSKLFGLAL